MGALMGGFVGPLVEPLGRPLVDPLVGPQVRFRLLCASPLFGWVEGCFRWEVLDGVGGCRWGRSDFPPFFNAFFHFSRFFFVFFFAFLRFSSLFSSSPKGQGQTTAKFTAKIGNFTPTPSASTPCKTSRFRGFLRNISGNRGDSRENLGLGWFRGILGSQEAFVQIATAYK